MLSWWPWLAGTFGLSAISAYGFLRLRSKGVGDPFGPHARPWAIFIVLATALVSTGFGLLILAVSHQAPAALVGVVVSGGLWLTSVRPPRDRLRAGWLARPLSRLYDAMGEDMQAWCDARIRAASAKPQWIVDAVNYYYEQVAGRLKDRRARDELAHWRESISHKVGIARLASLDTTPARLRESLGRHPATRNARKYTDDDLPRLARRLEFEAQNELNLFLALIYRLGYYHLAIYPYRPPSQAERARRPVPAMADRWHQ